MIAPPQRETSTGTGDHDVELNPGEEERLMNEVNSPRLSNNEGRFANATEFSRFIPELNPDHERAKTFRTKMSKRGTMLKLHLTTAFSVVILLLALSLWANFSYEPDENGVGTFMFGHCSQTSTINTAAHVLINVISSLFLSTGNYCMQILIAPSREEINAAHQKGRALEVGVPSIKNLFYIERKRTASWCLLGILSTTLHIFETKKKPVFTWNSSVFTSLPVVTIPHVLVTSDFRASFDNWTTTDPLTKASWWTPPSKDDQAVIGMESLYSLQDQVIEFTSIDKHSCIKSFINPLESTRSVVIVSSNITTLQNNGSSLIDGYISSWEEWWAWSNGWICSAYQITHDLKYCTLEWADSFADDWIIMSHVPVGIDYCLVSDGINNKERCGLHYSKDILGILCVCTFLTTLMITWTWVHHRRGNRSPDGKKVKRTMITIGDAIHSFLESPLDEDRNLQLSDDHVGAVEVCRTEWVPKRRIMWFQAVSNRTCAFSFLLFTIGIVPCIISVVSSYTTLVRQGLDSEALWGRGFGVHPAMTGINDLGSLRKTLTKTKTRAMLTNIIIANSPQLLVSFLYLFYNNILTRQLVADEWVRFLHPGDKKVLRVSSPKGMQRSSYFLSLPLKYSIPLMIISITIHWLVSQSIFLVQTSAFGPSRRGPRIPYFDDSTRGYSILGSTLAISLALISIVLLVVNSCCRHYRDIPPGFQRMGFNSRTLEIICQRPHLDKDAMFFPIKIGVVSGLEDRQGQLVFSTDTEIQKPAQNERYLQPIFIKKPFFRSTTMESVQKRARDIRLSSTRAWKRLCSAMRRGQEKEH